MSRQHCDPSSGLCFDVSEPPAMDEACPGDVWVGERIERSCPEAGQSPKGRWEVSGLFELAAAAQKKQLRVPATLDAYCKYTWIPVDEGVWSEPDLDALPSEFGRDASKWLDPDCRVVAGLGHPFLDLSWQNLEAAFFEQAERLAPLPTGGQSVAPVRLEIIDSAVTRRHPDGLPSFGQNPHGRVMGLIAHALACPAGGACPAQIASTLAMPLVATATTTYADHANGGFFGAQTDLATAILDATSAWVAAGTDEHLVINLSLGWVSTYGANEPRQDLPAPARAVLDAISVATCQGALVVAAAGNASGGPNAPVGPLFPGGWEQRPAPSAEACIAYGLTAPLPSGAGQYAPLLFSAGGVEGRDQAIASTPVGGRPRLAAPAAHAVLADQGGYADGFTGTSVAAAVTSAAATTVWGYRPDLTRAEVMDLVYGAAVDLGEGADYCLGGAPCPSIRRASVCRSVNAACANGGPRCPSVLPTCPTTGAGRDARPVEADLSSLPVDRTASAQSLSLVGTLGWPCNATLYSSSSTATAAPCPNEQQYGPAGTPWARPQPEGTPCTKCVLAPLEAILLISIDANYPDILYNPVLSVYDGATVTKFDLTSQVGSLAPGDTVLVRDLDGVPATFDSATLDMLIEPSGSVSDEVLLWQ